MSDDIRWNGIMNAGRDGVESSLGIRILAMGYFFP